MSTELLSSPLEVHFISIDSVDDIGAEQLANARIVSALSENIQ